MTWFAEKLLLLKKLKANAPITVAESNSCTSKDPVTGGNTAELGFDPGAVWLEDVDLSVFGAVLSVGPDGDRGTVSTDEPGLVMSAVTTA